MTKRMLIDGTHAEELRVVIADEHKIHDFEVETAGKAQLKGNIYVAEVDRVEPSLQAAFINYGGNRNGFLAFNEVHPSFFDIPEKEKKALLKELEELASAKNKDKQDEELEHNKEVETRAEEELTVSNAEVDEDAKALALVSKMDNPDAESANKAKVGRASKKKAPAKKAVTKAKPEYKEPIHRRYKINEVLKAGQKILIQVVKEERGTKGAALTTYFTFPGRYTVLMPNTAQAGGISRKVNDGEERAKMRTIYDALKVPTSMGLIIRTAGIGQDEKAIKKDYKSLTTLWKKCLKEFEDNDGIRCLHEDGSVVVRALRDIARGNLEEIQIEGNRIYKQAKEFAKALMPETGKIIKEYKSQVPIFTHYGVEQKLNKMHNTRVDLPSGGYLVINPTEALVSVDVNSGRATQQRNIEQTAFKTNSEAAEELARQLRLRDLAGLIVVDFIDMEDMRHVRSIEKSMRQLARKDRARVQVANLSSFGLMEISRQRLRPSFVESHYDMCSHCNGTGHVHSMASSALMMLRRLEEADAQEADRLIVTASAELVVYVLNQKREMIRDMEAKYKYQVLFRTSEQHMVPDFRLDLVRVKADGTENSQTVEVVLREQAEQPPEVRYRKQNKRGKRNDNRGGDRNKNSSGRDNKRNTRKTEGDGEDKSAKPKNSQRHSAKDSVPKRPSRASSKPVEAKAENTPAKVEIKKEPVKKEITPKKPVAKDKPLVVEKISVDGAVAADKAKATGSKFQRWWNK